MIKTKNAPAGWIAQYFSDSPDSPIPGRHTFLKVTGRWSPTREEALASVQNEKKRSIARLITKRDKIDEEIRAPERVSDTIMSD